MKKNNFSYMKKDSSLNLTFIIVVVLSSVLPLILSAFLLVSNYNHEKRLAESQNHNLKLRILGDLRQIVKDVRSNLTIGAQNQDVIDVLLASDSVRPFIENRAYGRLAEISNMSGIKADWALWSTKLNKIVFSSQFDHFPEKKLAEFNTEEFFLFNNGLFLSVPIKLDDQNLQGPNATTQGKIFGRIDVKDIKSVLPELSKILSVYSLNNVENFEIEIIEKNTTTAYVVSISLFILGLLIISISIGLFLFRENFIVPLKTISSKLLKSTSQTTKNEILVLEHAIESHISNMKIQELERSEKEKLIAANMIASQVAHDIRSPLTALNMVIGTIDKLPEDKRILIRSAIQRINDIANDLLSKGKMVQLEPRSFDQIDPHLKNNETATTVMLSSLIDILVSEKRTQYRDKIGIQIGADLSQSYGLFAKLPANELKRVLSNLINNSVEALKSGLGKIFVNLQEDGNFIKIEVVDNGSGIPSHVMARLGSGVVSFGKEGTNSGSGLGIQHAFKFISSVGGKINFISDHNLGNGTTVVMHIPKSQTPVWFVHQVEIPRNGYVVALDDDQSIHSVWQGRLLSLKAQEHNVTLISFTSADVFKNWVKSQKYISDETIFLVDYELLGQKIIGLDLVEELNLQKHSILVSSRYDEKNVYERCKRLGVRIIPKAMAGLVPMEISNLENFVDAVLIDDDELVHMTWTISAKENRKRILTYKTPEIFFSASNSIKLETPIIVDLHLSNGVLGDQVAQKIHDLGYKNIYLGTGSSSANLPNIPWIKGTLGKAPDWNLFLQNNR